MEGAGAYFALVLLDHLREGEHAMHEGVHRLLVGHYGCFDPFASIERVLGASDVRQALFAEVALAEAEASGTGPVARVVRELEKQVSVRGNARIARRFQHKVWIDTQDTQIELDLTRVVDMSRDESDLLVEQAVRRLVAAGSPTESAALLPWESARASLMPRVVGESFVAALPKDHALHLAHLASDVSVALVLRYKDRARYVRQDEVEAWTNIGGAPNAQALHNLARASERTRILRHDTGAGPILVLESRDGLDSARLLLPALREVFEAELGTPFVVGVPHRDTLLACALGQSEVLSEMRRRHESAALRAPHAITRSLLLVHADGAITQLQEGTASIVR